MRCNGDGPHQEGYRTTPGLTVTSSNAQKIKWCQGSNQGQLLVAININALTPVLFLLFFKITKLHPVMLQVYSWLCTQGPLVAVFGVSYVVPGIKPRLAKRISYLLSYAPPHTILWPIQFNIKMGKRFAYLTKGDKGILNYHMSSV